MTPRLALPAAIAALAAALAAAPAHAATPPITSDWSGCAAYGDQRICTGEVPSFDGAKLDVDLTLPDGPAAGGGTGHPLVVMLHGFGNDKHEWESTTDEGDGGDKWHWNSNWFARHGFYVLTYTARGFNTKAASEPYQPATPAGTSVDLSPPNSSGTIHLKSREFEARDTQWLAALVAAAYPVDPSQVAVTGGSYGGGESWLLASRARWSFPHEQDAALPVLDLQVAVPKYPWTDLGYSLAPNGHGGGPGGADVYESSTGRPESDTGEGNPVGIEKLSYTSGFFALGNADGVFEEGQTNTPSEEGRINIPAWYERVTVQGDPYDVAGAEDPVVAQIRRGLTEFRSAYYQDEGWTAQAAAREVAVYSISGWSDDLFPPVESFREFKYLKRLDPLWPVAVSVADVGHSRAQNPPVTWRHLNDQAWQFLEAQLPGSHRQQTTVTSDPTICGGAADPSMRVTATTPEGLANGTLTSELPPGATVSPLTATDPDGPATDPVVGGDVEANGGCRTSQAATWPGRYTAHTAPLPAPRTYIGLGTVRVGYTLTGANTATLLARLWDEAPDGTATLVTRGAYRIDAPAYDAPSGTLVLPFFGNHWRLAAGHRLRLDLTQVDAPTFRPSTESSALTLTSVRLRLPTLEAGTLTLPGG